MIAAYSITAADMTFQLIPRGGLDALEDMIGKLQVQLDATRQASVY